MSVKIKTPAISAAQFGEIIRRERKDKGMLQQDLADLSGVSHPLRLYPVSGA